MKINIVLFQPEIPQNTGNISRTCSATGSALHLVHPLGFSLDEKHLRRAGLDYWEGLEIHEYADNDAFFSQHGSEKIFYFSQKGHQNYWDIDIVDGTGKEVWLAFGCESKGLDEDLLLANAQTCVRIPMLDGKRSLNLSNAVAVAVYEVLRRTGFSGLRTEGRLNSHSWEDAHA
ncbi:MAG: tRNA (cytidine(34)-2'-O)-methyltransferase [Spirochaetales bacterium]|nr:tRNA (cytidine(34)-2'-O)-methyltransferase [Spirochaetales bacterium]